MQTKLILELGCNHQGKVDLALRMVDEAAKLGVYGVKLQMRDVDELPEEQKVLPRDVESDSFGSMYYDHRKALELGDDDVLKVKRAAETRGLRFVVSVFDIKSARRAVDELGVKHVKLPSQHLMRTDLISYLSTRKIPRQLTLMRSTGMHVTEEVVEWLSSHSREHDVFDVTYYCRSIYPYDVKLADLGSARVIFERLPVERRGYSSHDVNGALIPVLVFMGASWVERHYTLDHALKGRDQGSVSSTFVEVQKIIGEIEEAEDQLECKNWRALISDEERANAAFYRRERK